MSNYINWGHENPEQIQARRKYQTEMFEAMASAKAAANAAVGSSHPKPPSYFNESILWFEYNEGTGAYTRFVFNCNYSQILGPADAGFSDPWYVNDWSISNGGGYLIQWVNDDNGDTKYEFINSMNQSVHVSETLSNSTHDYWSDYMFYYTSQMVSYYTMSTSNTLKWVILHENTVYEYEFENVDAYNLENSTVDGVMLIRVNQFEGPSNTLVTNLYMLGAGYTEPLNINSTGSTTDYFRFGPAFDYVTTDGGDYSEYDTYANHFYVVEQLQATDEILQMKTYDKTGTLLFDLYEQLVNNYEFDPSDYYLEDWGDFGSGRMYFWLGNRDTNYYRLVLVSKEAGVYYLSEADSDPNGNWDEYDLLPGRTERGESFCYIYYNYEENYHFGFNQDGDWEMYLVGADGTDTVITGSGNADIWETTINKDGSAVFPCLRQDGDYYIASCVLSTNGTTTYKLLSDYPLVESGYYDDIWNSYDHIANETELFLSMYSEDGLYIINHIDGAGNFTESVVIAEFDSWTNLETNYPGFERQIILGTGAGEVYWFNRASKTFVKLLEEVNFNWIDSAPRYYGSKQNIALVWVDYSPYIMIKSDGSVIYSPANAQIVSSLGKYRYATIASGEEAQYITIHNLITGDPLTPAVPFGNMWIDGSYGNRLSFYDYYSGAVKCLTSASTYAYKYQADEYPGRIYNDAVWWDD